MKTIFICFFVLAWTVYETVSRKRRKRLKSYENEEIYRKIKVDVNKLEVKFHEYYEEDESRVRGITSLDYLLNDSERHVFKKKVIVSVIIYSNYRQDSVLKTLKSQPFYGIAKDQMKRYLSKQKFINVYVNRSNIDDCFFDLGIN